MSIRAFDSSHISNPIAQEFVAFATQANALCFGQFTTKAGRLSPYFFNAGLFNDGNKLGKLAQFYAQRLLASNVQFDMLFGPAYKGITLASAVAVELARLGHNKPFAYNRKEAKDHGEGGQLVGAPLQGRVLIIDDVISAGTSVRESIDIIKAAKAEPCAVIVALDRQEKATENGLLQEKSALQIIELTHKLKVFSIASLADMLLYIQTQASSPFVDHVFALQEYLEKYGAP